MMQEASRPVNEERIQGISVVRETATLEELGLDPNEKYQMSDIARAIFVKYDTTGAVVPGEKPNDGVSKVKVLSEGSIKSLTPDRIPKGCNQIRVITVPAVQPLGKFVIFETNV